MREAGGEDFCGFGCGVFHEGDGAGEGSSVFGSELGDEIGGPRRHEVRVNQQTGTRAVSEKAVSLEAISGKVGSGKRQTFLSSSTNCPSTKCAYRDGAPASAPNRENDLLPFHFGHGPTQKVKNEEE